MTQQRVYSVSMGLDWINSTLTSRENSQREGGRKGGREDERVESE